MANQDINNKLIYWYEGASSFAIESKFTYSIGSQGYWHNGSANGFLAYTGKIPAPRAFGILVGF